MFPPASHPLSTSGAATSWAATSWAADDLPGSVAALGGGGSPTSDRADYAAHAPISPDAVAQTLGRASTDPSRATLQLAGLTALPGWPAWLRIHVWHPGLTVPVLLGRMPNGPWVADHDLHLQRRADGSWRARGPLPETAWFDISSRLPEPALVAAVAALIRNGHETLGLLATLLGHPGRQVRLIDRTFEVLQARIVRAYEAGQVPPGRWHLPHLPPLPRPPRPPVTGPRPAVSAPPDRS